MELNYELVPISKDVGIEFYFEFKPSNLGKEKLKYRWTHAFKFKVIDLLDNHSLSEEWSCYNENWKSVKLILHNILIEALQTQEAYIDRNPKFHLDIEIEERLLEIVWEHFKLSIKTFITEVQTDAYEYLNFYLYENQKN